MEGRSLGDAGLAGAQGHQEGRRQEGVCIRRGRLVARAGLLLYWLFNECASYMFSGCCAQPSYWMDGMVALVAVVDRLAAAGGLESRAIAGGMGGAARMRERERAGESE